ncbi:MAG: DNA polymerase-3 subunit gamma/tau [Pelagibacterales bacterium]|nr:DNA polymerase-3 subunit gamma/tau [Pelagibacterales bacterium]
MKIFQVVACLFLKMINNKILALKYRPQEFKDLIGQEVISQTITNAINLGKTPNAYLLTGIRGVGKTTTARLIAKSLNCESNLDKNKECNKENFCNSCKEIVNSNHIDILEMDAASKTGIDDIRELIENSKYSPTSAQFKIFIIDEVHMLSKQAFNGLLKTLEEPPPRLKFILATTEVRKIPVTILSRCQRFDLKRVSLGGLYKHLLHISKLENGKISENALKLIARASEGSVRDAISLLDRALISQSISPEKETEDTDVRIMLGLADRSKLIQLFKEILTGDLKKSVSNLKELIDNGLDAKNFLNDILEIIYLFSRRISLGPIDNDMMISEAETDLINEYSKSLDIQDLGLFWQLTIKTIEDLKVVSNENLALEVYIMQLIHLKNIEHEQNLKPESSMNKNLLSPSELLNDKFEQSNNKKTNLIKNQLKSTDQVKESIIKNPESSKNQTKENQINSLQELINFANQKKEVELKYDLERNVKLVSFNKGKIDISFNEKLSKNFIKNLTEKLLAWTGDRWVISLSKKDGNKTIYEQNTEIKTSKLEKESNSQTAKKLFSAFPDAKLIEVKDKKND